MAAPFKSLPAGHVLAPAVTIALLAILLVGGLTALGILERVDLMLSSLLVQRDAEIFPNSLPAWAVWLATVLLACGLSFSILSVAGTWRRVILWATTLVLVAGWAPVLSLAAHRPEIAGPFIAAVWSGVCALVYAGNHLMESDMGKHK